MTLAFRLYGKFHWPPTAALHDNNDPASGVVEIHFEENKAADGAGKPGKTFLRWFPTDTVADPPAPKDLPTDHLFDLAPADAAKWFEGNKTVDSGIWLDATKSPPALKDQTWIIFRGAFLFEQYRQAKEGLALDLQWPLVTQCEYQKDTPVYSVLGICRRAKPLFYFNLHLPFPVRRTSLDDAPNVRAFPFSAAFDVAPKASDYLRIASLFGGWCKDDALPDQAETTRSFPFSGEKLPATRELGRFGFSEFGEVPGNKFALYKRDDLNTTMHYWPRNRQALIQDILWRYGFSLDYNKFDWLDATNLGRTDSSLRFPSLSGGSTAGSHRSRLIYRASVEKAAAYGTGDLQADGSGFRLRLKDEIGGRRADGTQFGAGDTDISIERAAEIEGWLRTGDTLSADCELSWEISRTNIWTTDRGADWSPAIATRLHWSEGFAAAAELAAEVTHDTEFQSGLLAHAGLSFRRARNALEPGEAGQPHSFLPDLSKAKSETVRFSLYGSPLPAKFKPDGTISWGRPAPTKNDPHPAWRRPPMRLSLASLDHLIAETPEAMDLLELRLTARALTFFQTPGVEIELRLSHDGTWPPPSLETVEEGDPFFASFAVEARPQDAWEGRLSSLQFSGAKLTQAAKQRGYIRVGGRGVRLGLGNGTPILIYPNGRIAAELKLAIAAATVEPIGVDVARSDRSGRPAPLLIPLDRNAQGEAGNNLLWLTATETLSPTQDRLLEAYIIEDSPVTGNRSYVVLSSEPFTIYRFTQRSLYDRGQEDDASIAFYSGDNRIWQYKRVSDYYHYILPPQVIGESADKPRRLEIHDLRGATETPPRPYVPRDPIKGPGGKDQPDPRTEYQRRAVEFRLTPSAEIWIRPSDVERGYFMPESTSYEIFRQSGEYGLGAALAFLRAEFLYGLPVGIDVAKERSIARGARVAEIEALTGKLTGPAREMTAETRIVNRWNALRSAVARRPERLEIWARDLDSVIDFTPARFTDGVQFALRHTALHRAPLIDSAAPERADYDAPPKVAGLDPSSVPTEWESYPRHHPQGLSGGALWPVESLNLFKTMLQAPQSNGGTIESIALSPLGGDATQKAEFLGGKVTIISDTRNGYVERQQVEVLGRICAFWHRAKHVVVYERTVSPSAQFAPKKIEDSDRTRSRRPILRKVREYIELLQPERNYPDFSTAAPRSAGFLERVRFNSKIINVDSAWSSEVGDFGWEIPLWNRLSARERPQVYPMPDIAFVSTAEGDGEKPVVAQECLDPDYLFFFADFKIASSDTNVWPSRLNLDFPNMPLASAIAKKADAKSSEDPVDEGHSEGRRRAVGRILPGLRRFTWRLAPAAQKAAVNAGRAGKPVYAGLDSVTFMRATHTSDEHKKLGGDLEKLFTWKNNHVSPDEENPAIVSLQYWDTKGAGAASAVAGEFATKLDAVIKSARNNSINDFKTARTELYSFWSASSLAADVKKLASNIEPSHFKDIPDAIKTGPSFCAKLKTDAVGMIQRKEMLVRAALQDWVAQADELLLAVNPYIEGTVNKDSAIQQLKAGAIKQIAPIFEEATKDVSKVEEGVEKSRAALLDLETEIEAVIDRARQRIAQFVNGYDQAKPWSQDRRKAFRNGLQACVSSVRDDIAAAIDEARQRLGVELNDVSQAIGGYVAKQLRQVATLEADALDRITTIGRAVDKLFEKIDGTLDQLLQGKNGGKLDELITKVKASTTIGLPLKNKAETVLLAMKSACTDATDRIADARTKAKAIDNRAEEALNQVADVIQAFVDSLNEIGAAVTQALKDLTAVAAEMKVSAPDISAELDAIVGDINQKVQEILEWPERWLTHLGDQIDAMVVPATKYLDSILVHLQEKLREIPDKALPVINDVNQALQNVQDALSPDGLLKNVITDQIIGVALVRIFDPLPDRIDPKVKAQIEAALTRIRTELDLLAETVGGLMRNFKETALPPLEQVTSACNAVFEGAAQAEAYLKGLADDAQKYINDELNKAYTALTAKLDQVVGTLPQDVAGLIDAVNSFDRSVRGLQNNMSRAYETARMYADRVMDQVSKLGDGGILAAPSNILKLYSAVTSAPEIAALKADIDRIRAGYDELSDIIDTTKANALFNRLGDELKALGLSLPFDKIGDRLLPADLSNVDIAKVFRSFGGAKFSDLLKGYKIPAGVQDAIRISHDFDKKQARAWVQVDINAPMAGRRSLFSVGVFKADFVDMQLTGQVRLEASKDQDKVTETGYGRIGAAIDLVVGGQSMVRFEKFGLNYTREKGLVIEFDPKNIRLNPSFKFIQDFLSTLFPDDVGGLHIIKLNGIPVGVQHDFAIPPLSLNFGTSGVSNISIENHFKLVAFPDFMLANRFNLSTVERPFIFSIFIIGGTGYIQIDAEYRPFDSELTVSVEAGAGGSASLAFAFGPFVGQVFITLSGVLTYRKVIGKPGGGLSISVVLVIAGHVDVCGIVTVGIVLMLRMTYRDDGQVDGQGSLEVTIRISRFFKISARADVKYKLRGGKSETVVTSSANAELEPEMQEKVDKLKSAAKKLEKARN